MLIIIHQQGTTKNEETIKMPIRGRGAFPKPSSVHREGGGASENGSNAVILEYRALKKLQNSTEALNILRRIGNFVRPIMMKHGWKLPLLVEMYPKQENLLGLNVNKGKKIALRLRRPYNDLDFIDEESIVETMLHELAHNLRGPHDEIFFQHLETLTQEYHDLRSNKTLPGLGFMSTGRTLGGSNVGGLNDIGRRRNFVRLNGSGSNRIGGHANSNLSPREAAAAAAHRRKVISMGCPSHNVTSTQEANEEQERQELIQGVEVITIEDEDDDDDEDNDDDDDGDDDFQIIEDRSAKKKEESDDEIEVTSVKRLKREKEGSNSYQSKNWNCQRCTLLNDRYAETCNACQTIRPGIACWICRSCQHRMIGAFADFWCCTKCQTVKVA